MFAEGRHGARNAARGVLCGSTQFSNNEWKTLQNALGITMMTKKSVILHFLFTICFKMEYSFVGLRCVNFRKVQGVAIRFHLSFVST